MKEFAHYHPFTIFCYFLVLVSYTMFQIHPVNVFIALLCSLILFLRITDLCKTGKQFLFLLFFIFLIAGTNPLFVHQGVTILCYINDNPITLEALQYGASFAFMAASVLTLCRVFHHVMSHDRFLYLCASIMPNAALVLSMIMRMLPKFQRQYRTIRQVQNILIKHTAHPMLSQIRLSIVCFSMMITWALETSIDTADSMKARGYGTCRRTTFQLFHFERRDVLFLVVLSIITLLLWFLQHQRFSHFYFYPERTLITYTLLDLLGYGCYILLFAMPLILEWREGIRWTYAK